MKMERDFTCGREEGWFNSRGSKYLSVDDGRGGRAEFRRGGSSNAIK